MKKDDRPTSTLADRIQWVIDENGLKKSEFAKAMGISANYVYLLTSGRKTAISEALAKLIGVTYGVPADWILQGEAAKDNPATNDLRSGTIQRLKKMDIHSLRSVAAFIRTLNDTKDEK